MNMVKVLLASSLLMLMANHAAAHHSWAAIFNTDGDAEIDGVVSRIEWRNPHIRLEITTDPGTPEEKVWDIESNSVASLVRMGVTPEVLTEDTEVTIAGYPVREGDDSIFMNHLLLPDNTEVIFLRGAEPRWEGETIGTSDRLHGNIPEEDFSERPTSIFAVWSTIYGAEGSHRALRYPRGQFEIDYAEPRGVGNCVSKDVWTEMGSPYPMQLIDNGDIVIVHVEEFDTIRTVHMGIDHNDPGTVKNNLGYSTGRMEDGKLFVTTTFEGSSSPVQFRETFQLSADHNRLEYTSTLFNPESGNAPAENSRWWEFQLGSFVQPYDCSQ